MVQIWILEGEEPPAPPAPRVGDVLCPAASASPCLDPAVGLSHGDFLVFEQGGSPLISLAESEDAPVRPIIVSQEEALVRPHPFHRSGGLTCDSVGGSDYEQDASGQVEVPTQGHLDEQGPGENVCLTNRTHENDNR